MIAPRSVSEAPRREPVFKIREVSKIYEMGDVKVSALDSVDLDLYRGELAVLLGASGSGKSTLLNIIGGLDVPTSGTVTYLDHVLTKADDAELTRFRREHVGFVFQFYNLIPSLTALENVQLIVDIASNPMEAATALDIVGLADRMKHFPAQLSGGEQQRVAIARAIAKQPDVLLCDEPTGALDYITGKLVLEVIERVNQNLGTTTAVITHNADDGALNARVRNVEPQAFTKVSALGVEEQRVNVIIDFDKIPENLGDNYRVDVGIVLWEGKDVLRVPSSALFRSADAWSVYVVERGKAVPRTVEIGHRSPSFAEVTSGLSEGESVILHPPSSITDGTRVTSP